MNRFLLFIFGLLLCVPAFCDDCETLEVSGPCSPCHYVRLSGDRIVYRLAGDVRVIPPESKERADIYVYLCQPGEVSNLVVKWVEKTPDLFYYCGYWCRVDQNEDFTIKFTDDYWNADLRIRYGEPLDIYFCDGCGYPF